MTAIVTDAHYRMSVSLIRDLADRGVRVVACEKASIKNPVGFASRGVLRCVRLPAEGHLDALLDLCREIAKQEEKKPVLLPVGAKTLALLSEHRERFSPVAGLCIATPTQLALLNDKAAVGTLAQKLSVPIPENFERKSGENLDAFFSRVPLPCAVKPHCGEKFGLTAAQRYRICHTKETLQEAFSHFQAITQEDPIVQEYLPGEAFGCSILAKDGAVYRTICHHRLREYPVSGGPSSCCESISRPDVIVVDPPRKGVSEDVIEAMAQMNPERIVYVSCDPATLARDIARLREKGYEAKKAHCFDLFPRCAHVETVALLEKTGDGQENADCGEMR